MTNLCLYSSKPVVNYVSKVKGGWVVRGRTGKRLSKVYKTKAAARRRLRQIEFFKHKSTHNTEHVVTNAILSDPTRTGLIVRSFVADINRRLRRLKRDINVFLVRDDELGLVPRNRPAGLQQTYAFETSSRKLAAFRDWLDKQVEARLLTPVGGLDERPWTATYVESAYRKGMVRAYTDANRARLLEESDDFVRGSKAQFLNTAFAAPEVVSKIELVATRSFEKMKGLTGDMKGELNRILAEGIANGQGAATVARQMRQRIDGMSKARSMRIARTELVYAHAEGQLDSFERLGIEELDVLVEWVTIGAEACPLCTELEGQTFTLKEAHGLIPYHPNCRCAWIPAEIDDSTKKKRRR